MKPTLIALLMAASLLPIGAAHAQTAPAPAAESEMAKALQPFVDQKILPGAVVLLASKDKVLDLACVGYADLETQKKMAPDTLFWIASMSKPITAAAFMMLVDEGKVSLDDLVEKYLPDFKGQQVIADKNAKPPTLKAPVHPITIRNILAHTSGLPFASPQENPTLDMLTLKEGARTYASLNLQTEPDSNYAYSNAGINTAGRIIEVITGMPYEKFLEERLFKPLGMVDTTFVPTEAQVARLASSYKIDERKVNLLKINIGQLHYPLTDAKRQPMPAGGLFSTAGDTVKFCQMLANGGVYNGKRYLSENAIKEMTTDQTGALKKGYGLGCGAGADSYGHGGAFRTDMQIARRTGDVYVFLVQQAGDWPLGGDKIMPAVHEAKNKILQASRTK